VHVLQGEGEMASSHGVRSLGKFQLTGIPAAPRGMPQIEVTFDIDANGIVQVSAKDRATGREQAMTITGGTALPREDIDRMIRDAEQYAAEDRKRREEAELRNNADNLVYQTEKLLADHGDKVSSGDKDDITKSVEELKQALKGTDAAAIRNATERLTQVSHKLAQAMYSSQEAGQGESGAGSGTASGDVVDAEIVDEGNAS
jgi:molecular chaperone DnaK